jgi:biopolymer transport protein ExbB/TolQ
VATQYRLLTLFADGGWMMYPLVLCSLIATGVMIAKAWTLWLAHRGTKTLLEDVEQAAMSGDIDGAIEIARSTPGPASAILLAGLRRMQNKTVAAGRSSWTSWSEDSSSWQPSRMSLRSWDFSAPLPA